jgi:hypothetical protein
MAGPRPGDDLRRELAAARALLDDATVSARPAVSHLAAALRLAGHADLGRSAEVAGEVRAAAEAEPWRPVALPRRRLLRRLLRRLEQLDPRAPRRRRARRLAVGLAAATAVAMIGAVIATHLAADRPARWRARYDSGDRATRADVDGRLPGRAGAASFDSCLVLPRDRPVALQLVADGRSSLAVDGRRVAVTSGRPGDRVAGAVLDLAAGVHPIRIEHRAPPTGAGQLAVYASVDNRRPAPIDPALLRLPDSDGDCEAGR